MSALRFPRCATDPGDTLISQLKQRLQAQKSFEEAVHTILSDIIALHGAEYGNLQLLVRDKLVIVAQSGLSAPFLRTFKAVTKEDGCACGRAFRLGIPIIIADVNEDKDFTPYRAAANLAGYRAVQSTPLITSDDKFVGVVSTLFAQVHWPTKIEMDTLGVYCELAADQLRALVTEGTLASHAQRMNQDLYARLKARHPDNAKHLSQGNA